MTHRTIRGILTNPFCTELSSLLRVSSVSQAEEEELVVVLVVSLCVCVGSTPLSPYDSKIYVRCISVQPVTHYDSSIKSDIGCEMERQINVEFECSKTIFVVRIMWFNEKIEIQFSTACIAADVQIGTR